jgi:aconitate hydratase
MAPEYGATMGFFGVDEETVAYLRGTGRSEELCKTVEAYYKAQGMWGIPTEKGSIEFTTEMEMDISTVEPCVSGPKRPQDRITVSALKSTWGDLLTKPTPQGYGKQPEAAEALNLPPSLDSVPDNAGSFAAAFGAQQGVVTEPSDQPSYPAFEVTVDSKDGVKDVITHGSVLIAAITSCTNTSNPSVMLAAGLLAKKANALGLTIKPSIKTSLGPGSRVVTDYLTKTGLQPELDKLGFQTVGYGCTTCIGNSGPLDAGIEDVVKSEDIIAASVLSGNRNFEARVHQSIKANFLMSPPLVVAYAIAGTVDIDLSQDELVPGSGVYLKDIWATLKEVRDAMESALSPDVFRKLYTDFASQNPKWNEIQGGVGEVFEWDGKSTYIQHPPFFADFSMTPGDITEIKGARPLGIFGDSVTTDHISPAGAIKKASPAGRFLLENGVTQADFNSFGSRRGNDLVMTRGTFANVRIKNLMLGGKEGGDTLLQPAGTEMSIYDAAVAYQAAGTPSIILGGEDYGMGHHEVLRAHPPQQPRRHGRPALQLQEQGRLRQGQGSQRCHLRPPGPQQRLQAHERSHPPRPQVRRQHLRHPRRRPHRHPRRNRLLPRWRHPAVCARADPACERVKRTFQVRFSNDSNAPSGPRQTPCRTRPWGVTLSSTDFHRFFGTALMGHSTKRWFSLRSAASSMDATSFHAAFAVNTFAFRLSQSIPPP